MDPASSPALRAVPLMVTGDPRLRADLLRLCAAAGVSPDLVDRPELVRTSWRNASSVVVGSDHAGQVATLGLPRRDDVLVVTSGPETATVWRDAVGVGAMRVVTLPAGQDWLISWFTDTSEGAGAARVIGVVGARGGAGASTLAAALAVRAARRLGTCLIDADPLSGGVELVLGSEDREGLRWDDVVVTEGRVGAAAFRSALPEHRGVTVLSGSRGSSAPIGASTMRTMLAAAGRSFDLLVLDLPRRLDLAAAEAAAACDLVLVVSPADVRAVAACAAMLPAVQSLCSDVRLVVRSAGTAAPPAQAMADSLGLPLAAVIPSRRSVERHVNDGLGPPTRGPLAARCDDLLHHLLPGRDAA